MSEQQQSPEVEARVDWLTCTSREDHLGHKWYEFFLEVISTNSLSQLNNRKDWRALGYNGERSVDDGLSIRWGYSEQNGYILIMSGPTAHYFWRKIIKPPLPRVTRIDLAVTITTEEPRYNLAQQGYYSVRNGSLLSQYHTTNQGGETLYLGSRSSQQVGRLYDKGAEKKAEPGHIWRYEVEYKKPKSGEFVSQVYESWADDERYWFEIYGLVWEWFSSRGIVPIFDARPDHAITTRPELIISTPTRRLAWLRDQVRPTVQELIAQGLKGQALNALGLEGAWQQILPGLDE